MSEWAAGFVGSRGLLLSQGLLDVLGCMYMHPKHVNPTLTSSPKRKDEHCNLETPTEARCGFEFGFRAYWAHRASDLGFRAYTSLVNSSKPQDLTPWLDEEGTKAGREGFQSLAVWWFGGLGFKGTVLVFMDYSCTV